MELGIPERYRVTVGDAWFEGTPLDTTELNRLVKKHTTVTVKRGRTHEEFDVAGFGRELFERTITAWGNVTRAGEPLECTPENRRWVFEKHSDVAGEVLDKIDEARRKHREELEGN
ncbi:hypothetical protein [Deferrisoma camini]|uniref:hypothetical protein n=1 Tax=Deferrisoma camini TaxID=1035120 RepID=UPI00046D329B|nr:hypothetical protein [Deferrisoma camini]